MDATNNSIPQKHRNPLVKLFNWYFGRRSLPYWCILLLDCLIIFGSAVFVHWMFYGAYQTLINFGQLSTTMLLYLLISIMSFKIFSTYSGIVRYSSFVDLQRVALANILAMAVVLLYHYVFAHTPAQMYAHFTAKQIIFIYVIATLIMWAVRVIVKTVYDITTTDRRARRVLIYGVQDGGVALAKSIRTQRPAQYLLKGFIAHDKQYSHHMLMGEKVYDADESLCEVITKQSIDAVLISPLRNEEFRHDTKLQDLLIDAGVRIYMMEGVREWNIDKDFTTADLREVSVEDLLPREQIHVDMLSVGRKLSDKRILITGSAGSIGSEMVRQIAGYSPASMMLIDQAETPQHDIRLMMLKNWPEIPCQCIVTSICHKKRMERIFADFRPDFVFHVAAYKHVPMMEDNPSEAILNNVLGTKVIADLSVKYGVKKFVMVSTDKAVNPTNVMGCSKRICEIYCQSLNRAVASGQCAMPNGQQACTQFVTTRFGNVLGSNGSVIPLFQSQIKKGGPVTVTHPDIIRYFMLIPEACKLVLEAGTKGNGGEIFVFDMGKPVRIAELAQRMIKLSGAKGVEIKFTGLRAGEKLYEEVLSEGENTKPSFHEKIRIAEVREYEFEQVSHDIEELIAISEKYDDMATVRKMKAIVPEYKSNNSVYSIIDEENSHPHK